MLQNCNKSSADTRKVNNVITNRQKSSEISQKIKVNDKFLTNPVEIVQNFKLHFSTIWKQTSFDSNTSQNSCVNSRRNYYNSFAWFEVQEKEISDIIKSLESNKANSAENISVRVLKLINSHIAPIISKLINLAF